MLRTPLRGNASGAVREGSAGTGGRLAAAVLTQENLSGYKQALTEALRTTGRADDALNERFIELKPGLMATLASPTNHLLTGRRGVGKSTTLAVLQRLAQEKDDWVVFVDVETHKSRAYPDVLIEIFLDILKEISPPVYRVDKLPLRRRIGRIKSVLTDLRDAHQEVVQSKEATDSRDRQAGVSLDGAVHRKFLKLTGGGSRSRSRNQTTSQSSQQTRRKEDFLRDLAPPFPSHLRRRQPFAAQARCWSSSTTSTSSRKRCSRRSSTTFTASRSEAKSG